MKTTKYLIMAAIMVALCCSIAKAQTIFYPTNAPQLIYSNAQFGATLIYSNAFNGSATQNISNTPPNYAVTLFGGSNNAVWIDVGGPGDTNALFANGEDGTSQGDSWLLPFNAQSNHVYTLQGTVTFTGNEGSWVTCGYAQHYANFPIANAPWNSSIAAIAWTLRNFTGNTEYFSGPTSGTTIYNNTPPGATGNGTYQYLQILDTTSNKWTTTAYFNGSQLGAPFTYSTIPTVGAIGVGQHVGTTINVVQWNSLTLVANQLAILQQPAWANVDEGSSFTNTVIMGGTPPFSYQWYTNGVALANATNASLILSSVTNSMAGNDYYCVVTNVYGAVTSAPATLAVYTTPQFLSANPVTYTNPMTLFGGATVNGTNVLGSGPSFSVFAAGQQPVTYFWLTNGVAVGGAINTNFTFANCQLTGPTNFTCIASNSLGTATNTWAVQYIPAPTAPYPQQVLADGPAAYWRLDDPNYDDFNDGEICNDFMSGNNGIYSNVVLSASGYWVTNGSGADVTNDPTETAAVFTSQDYFTGDYIYGLGTNVDFSAVSNAEFTVSIWVNGGVRYSTLEPQNSGIMVKGYYGTEEFGLDDGAGGGDLRFFLRSAANTLYSASSGVQVGGSNVWFHVVGVCDESNQMATLYINGLRAAQISIPLNSGLLHDGTLPISLGENLSPGNLDSTHQFYGALDDAAIFPYAMTAGQVAQLYQAAGGVTPTLVVPPPTNAAYMTGSTLTIPASAFGLPTMGYYWTNVTSGGILASGLTNVEQTLNATLIISNAPATLSGDQFELVISNATFSTNFLVTVFSPPPAVTLGYTNGILYTNEFYGGNWTISHQSLTAENMLIGGTNSTWIDVQGTNDTGYMGANGIDNSALGNSWIVPFTPHAGYVYTMSASCTFNGNPGNWIGMGFCQNLSSNSTAARFDDNGPNGVDWILWQYNGNVQYFAPGQTFVTNVTPFMTAGNATHIVQVVLDTTQPQWSQYAFVDGVPAGTNSYVSNPTIAAAGITQNSMTAPNENNIVWNYWSLSQYAPGGVPPYLLPPLPSTSSILLTNATITIPATGFGSAVLGYYWINNSTVLASGATNNMAPLPANLSIPSTSLSAGQLQLVVTNAYGTNITTIPLVSAIPTTGTNITWGVTNGSLYLSWPSSYTGYQLQAQTNGLGVGISTNWVNVPGSSTTDMVSVPINITNGSVFYRLIYTP